MGEAKKLDEVIREFFRQKRERAAPEWPDCGYCGYPVEEGQRYCSRACALADIEDDRSKWDEP